MTGEAPGRLGYMPGIDGLRAVSVLLVLVFHAGLNWLPGGFVGVSVFFTLSGFLITTLLVTEFERAGRVSLAGFWGRRFRRLVPAALLTIGAVCIWSRLDGPTGPSLRGDALWAVFNVANWRSAFGERTYADLFVGPSPLLHLWSLAIEEQFYFALPLVLIVVWAMGVRRRGLVVGFTIAAIVSGFAGYLTVSPSLAYYGTHVRAAELFTGCALGAAVGGRLAVIPGAVRRALPLVAIGGLAVLGSVARFGSADSQVLVHGGLAALSLASGAAVIGVALPGPLAGVLGWWPLRQLGRVSYGVYLFHWPVFVGFHERGHTGLAAMAIATAITIGLAVVSFALIEMPIRSGTVLRGRASLAGYPTGVGVVVSLALLLAPATAGGLDFISVDPATPVSFTAPETTVPARPVVLVVGTDSTVASRLREFADQIEVIDATDPLCPTLSVSEYVDPTGATIVAACGRERHEQTLATHDPDAIVVAFGALDRAAYRAVNGAWVGSEPTFNADRHAGLMELLDLFTNSGAPTFVHDASLAAGDFVATDLLNSMALYPSAALLDDGVTTVFVQQVVATTRERSRPPRVLVIGDSTGGSLQKPLAEAAAGTFDVVGASIFGCPLVRAQLLLLEEGVEHDTGVCVDFERDLPRLIEAYDIDMVVGVFGVMEQVPQRYADDDQWYTAGSDGYLDHHRREMVRLVEVLRRYDVPLVLLDSPYLRSESNEHGHRPEEVDAWNAVIDQWDRDYDEIFRIEYARWFPEAGSDADRVVRPDSVHIASDFALQVSRDHLLPQLSAVLEQWAARSSANAGTDEVGGGTQVEATTGGTGSTSG